MSIKQIGPADQGRTGKVRSAIRSDVKDLALLNEAVQELHARLYPSQFRSGSDRREVASFFSGLLSANKHAVGVYEDAGELIAYLWLEELERPASPFMNAARRLHIHHISVRPDRRRNGIGSALLDWADQEARRMGILEVTAEHWTANVDARRFFDREGFCDVRIVMARSVATS